MSHPKCPECGETWEYGSASAFRVCRNCRLGSKEFKAGERAALARVVRLLRAEAMDHDAAALKAASVGQYKVSDAHAFSVIALRAFADRLERGDADA